MLGGVIKKYISAKNNLKKTKLKCFLVKTSFAIMPIQIQFGVMNKYPDTILIGTPRVQVHQTSLYKPIDAYLIKVSFCTCLPDRLEKMWT